MRIVGIDPSLSSTGVAVLDTGRLPLVFSVQVSGRRAATVAERGQRIETIAMDATAPADDADLVVIEAPAFNFPGGSTWDRAGLWWRMVGRLSRYDMPVAEVSPTTRAKWATNRGNASKQPVKAAVEQLWSLRTRNDDEADALALATMGGQHLGWDVPTLERQRACLDAVAWPETDPNEGVAV